MRRALPGGFELDDERDRIDVAAVHHYLCHESYWAAGRSRAAVQRTITEAARVVGLYDGERQIGFARVMSDGVHVSHLYDVYVLSEYRGCGLGVALVREAVDNGPHAARRLTGGSCSARVGPERTGTTAGEGTATGGVESDACR